MLGGFRMNPQHASDEVTDLIASIEMHRQEVERESGLEASRTYALPRLQELLRTEQEAAQQPDAEVNRAANIEAVNAAIRKLHSLGRGGGASQRRQGKPQGEFRGPRREGQGQGQGPGQGQGQPGRPGHGQQPRHRGRRQQARGRGGGR
jgi:hypothetical protein